MPSNGKITAYSEGSVPFTLHIKTLSTAEEYHELCKTVFVKSYRATPPGVVRKYIFADAKREDFGLRVAVRVAEEKQYFTEQVIGHLIALGKSFRRDKRVLCAAVWGARGTGVKNELYPCLQVVTVDTDVEFVALRAIDYLSRGDM